VVQPLGERRGVEHVYRHTAGAFARNRDIGWVAPERRDVLLDPPQGGDLIERAVVDRKSVVRVLAAELRMREPPETSDAIVEACDEDSLLGKVGAAVRNRRGAAVYPATAIDPDEDGQGAGRGGRLPDVQIQSVFRPPFAPSFSNSLRFRRGATANAPRLDATRC
jgi:hypothetical protein